MSWRTAFLAQARSDAAIRRLLNRERTEYSHQLHYLQMMTEKLAKSLLASAGPDPPATDHAAFVRCLQVLKGRPELRRQLGYQDRAIFRKYIDSLLPLARQVERLAPNFAKTSQPNPEYPWQPAPDAPVITPAEYRFPGFDPLKPQMIKLVDLIERLLRILS